ncbi:MAG: hypothetical protein E7Z91_02435 [Cyanobacteria bacterium SIG30]|nr:hypothetical protein [Cyanobacteria bacterium SIG30]
MKTNTTHLNNVLLFLENKTEELENKIALGIKSHLGWQELTFKGVSILSQRLASHLISIGIEKGDRIAILSESMPEWGATLFASVLAGGTTVPLDIKLTIYELTSIVTSCQPKVILTSVAYLETAEKLKEAVPSIEHIILINESGVHKEYTNLYSLKDSPNKKWRHRSLNKTALIIYTSGTTGMPKGVEVSFKNMIAQVESLRGCFNLSTKDQILSILPMNHLFELTVGFLSFLNMGTSIYYSQSLKPKDLFNIIREKKITFMIAVPAFLKLLRTSIEAEVESMSKFGKFAFAFLYRLSKFIPFYRVRKLMFKRIHKKFGGKFKGFMSGGAPLDIEIYKFFDRLGFKIYEGYGLSEASPVVSMNVEGAIRPGSVGRPIPNVYVKIDEETGELMVKGDNVMKGYYNQPDLTDEVITPDGWLHTGDIAKIDRDGFIFITGRIKNMIVLSGGKKVFPEEVESVLALSDKFSECCVFGAVRKGGQKDGTEDIAVVVVPKNEIVEGLNDDEVLALMRKEVKELSQRLSNFKRPVSVFVSRELLPRTATSKIKRKEVKAKFSVI